MHTESLLLRHVLMLLNASAQTPVGIVLVRGHQYRLCNTIAIINSIALHTAVHHISFAHAWSQCALPSPSQRVYGRTNATQNLLHGGTTAVIPSRWKGFAWRQRAASLQVPMTNCCIVTDIYLGVANITNGSAPVRLQAVEALFVQVGCKACDRLFMALSPSFFACNM